MRGEETARTGCSCRNGCRCPFGRTQKLDNLSATDSDFDPAKRKYVFLCYTVPHLLCSTFYVHTFIAIAQPLFLQGGYHSRIGMRQSRLASSIIARLSSRRLRQ